MDIKILRAIVQSHSEVMKEPHNAETFERSLAEEKFPPMDRTILAALTGSFTNLISQKVSPEAYQRYSVRIQVIEVLRRWLRPTMELHCSRTFFQGDKLSEFVARILRIYLSNELLYRDDNNIDVLVNLARALVCLIPRRKSLARELCKLVKRIALLERTADSERLLLQVLEEKDSLELCSDTLESLWVSQRVKLIEEPLMENFISNLKESTSRRNFESSCNIEGLLEISVESATIFHIACSVLKDIFVNSEYSPRVMDYIRYYLKSVDARCNEKNINILDLYPLGLQALIILLKISPEQHTSASRKHTLETLEKIYFTNREEILVLLTHFPSWLPSLSNLLEENSRIKESNSITSVIVSDEENL